MESTSPATSWFDQPVAGRTSLRREHLLWAILILAAAVTRFAMLEPRVISHDEGQHVQMAWSLFRGAGYTPNPMTHGPFQILAVAASYALFGASDFSSRVPAALFGVAAVALLYLFRRWLGKGGALAAGALMLVSPYMLYYSRYVRNESFVVVWGLLMFYAVGRYLESRQPRWLYLLAAALALHYATKETAFIYAGLAILFLLGLVFLQLSRTPWESSDRKARFQIFLALAILLAVCGLGLIVAGRAELIDAARAAGVVTDPERMTHTDIWISHPMVVLGLALIFASAGFLIAGAAAPIREFGLAGLREKIPAVDLLVVFSTTLLPQLAALPMAVFNLNPFDGDPYEKIKDVNYIFATLVCLAGVTVPAVAVGWMWNRKLWAICAGIFFGVYVLLFSVCFTNFSGVVMGLIAAVNYWMAQQEVQRGAQPWYYYLILQIPMYEYLPALLALTAPGIALFLRRKPASAAAAGKAEDSIERAEPTSVWRSIADFPMVWLFGYWSLTALLVFTLAGEKMPWLTVHIALPFILLGGWAVSRVAEGVDWPEILEWPRWVGLAAVPAALIAAVAAAGSALGGARPLSGDTLDALSASGDFVFLSLMAVGGILLIGSLWRGVNSGFFPRLAYLGTALVLGICSMRAAWMASYIHYDDATEFLVYAHAASGVKTAMTQIEDISRKTAGGVDLVVPYDVRSGWLLNWYLREYPNAYNYGDRLERPLADAPVVIVGDFYWSQADQLLSETHYAFTYMRMWWPMMDYFGLTWDRVWNAVNDPAYRSALWRIWFYRDYGEYARLTNQSLTLSNWPSGERMRLYVRKDLAAQVWQYGSEAFTPPAALDPYAGAVRSVAAADLWGLEGEQTGAFQRPRAVAAAPDGSFYVADTGNHRIQHFGPQGDFLTAWGSFSGMEAAQAPEGTFNEPWGVAVGPDGSVYVADTWNYRVQKFAPDGEFLAVWGATTSADPGYQFYGPRAIAVDSQNRVFVADTGNKRIVYFDSEGNYLGEIGSPGFDYGQFDEPVGLAFAPDGRLYVADTWNRRIQVFQEIERRFEYFTEWPVAGWEGQSTDTKPYLAVSADGRVWATDPGNARILVFDADGAFLFTFGAYGTDAASFAMPTGIAVDAEGRVFVTDTDNHRVMLFSGL
ncbi:MAG: TIGR03663 family protein [Anaerolineales bacterium]|nr:TIGR03663 family protein [Anaerolineales bacterium]